MREQLNQWDFVVAAYAVGLIATFAMLMWAWNAMIRAEKRRDEAKEKMRRK